MELLCRPQLIYPLPGYSKQHSRCTVATYRRGGSGILWAAAACQLRCSIQIGLLRSRLYLVACILYVVSCVLCCALRQLPFCSRISAFVSRMQIEFVDVVAGSCDVFALLSSCRLRLSLIGRTSIVFPFPTHTHSPLCACVCDWHCICKLSVN